MLAALGLRPKQIVGLVITESALLAGLSALVGTTLGLLGHLYLATEGVTLDVGGGDGFTFNGVVLDPVIKGDLLLESVLGPVLVLLIVSVLGGLWPARRAARLDPATALNKE